MLTSISKKPKTTEFFELLRSTDTCPLSDDSSAHLIPGSSHGKGQKVSAEDREEDEGEEEDMEGQCSQEQEGYQTHVFQRGVGMRQVPPVLPRNVYIQVRRTPDKMQRSVVHTYR